MHIIFVACIWMLCVHITGHAQIIIKADTSAQRLVGQLVGNGVAIKNFHFTGAKGQAGTFNFLGGIPLLGIDSGIVISTGLVKTGFITNRIGIDGIASDGSSGLTRASSSLSMSGDADLANIIAVNHDAGILEFDFVPTGDSIVFRYVFASEEYPQYNCSKYNDVFAFFISGPGITGKKNIALIPNTNIPVAINSVNNGTIDPTETTASIGNCTIMGAGSPFTKYYVDNSAGQYITFNGFTKVLEARSAVQPCQTYHLKLAIADGSDFIYDSGVFLEAKSLRSDGLFVRNVSLANTNAEPYLAEGCQTGGIRVVRPNTANYPQQVTLTYAGTATNGIDVQPMPLSVTIPTNDTSVFVPIITIADNLPEGVEKLKIYISSGCANVSNLYADSVEIQIRDYDTLSIIPTDTAGICKGSSLQLTALGGYTSYTWTPAPLLSSAVVFNPIASPVVDGTAFICTAVLGTCQAKDSVKVFFRKLNLSSKQDVICKDVPIGQIKASPGKFWQPPLQFSINGRPSQTDSVFSNLTSGNYLVKLKDASGCMDSVAVQINQLYPSLEIDSTIVVDASCSDSTSGSIKVIASGGKQPYSYALYGQTYQAISLMPATVGNHSAIVKDINGCTDTSAFMIRFNNTVSVYAGADTTICEGGFAQFNAISNTTNIRWLPTANLSNSASISTQATPISTTTYTITATDKYCQKIDTIIVNVRKAPLPNAGVDTTVCTGGTLQLQGSGGTAFKWTPTTYLDNASLANPTARPLGNITYRLHVIDQFNCPSLQQDEVYVRTVPSVRVFAGNDTIAAVGQPMQLRGQQIGDTSATIFNWSPPTGLNDPNIINPIAILYRDQTYRLTMTTSQGCNGYDDIKIKVYNGPEIYVPSAFTPNGDGQNDVLHAVAVGIKTFKYFNIYNRWGQLVFSTNVPSKGWDGKINGMLQNNQAFVWMAEGIGYNNTMVKRQGSIVLIQ